MLFIRPVGVRNVGLIAFLGISGRLGKGQFFDFAGSCGDGLTGAAVAALLEAAPGFRAAVRVSKRVMFSITVGEVENSQLHFVLEF
jgi:hypothetical protein